jgi:hypothetical protein
MYRIDHEGWDFLLHGLFCFAVFSNLTYTGSMHFYGTALAIASELLSSMASSLTDTFLAATCQLIQFLLLEVASATVYHCHKLDSHVTSTCCSSACPHALPPHPAPHLTTAA